MAKSRTEAINKSQAIRDALQAHPERSPSEIAEQLKAKGLDVNAQLRLDDQKQRKGEGPEGGQETETGTAGYREW